jgi:hypothetical protein
MLRTVRTATGIVLALGALALAQPAAAQGLRGLELREALKDNADDFWIYDDIDAGYGRAKESGKPLLISFRCVP